MKLLCLSNGHGEDAIALRILQALQHHPERPRLAVLPLVGEGHAFAHSDIPLIGPVKQMPSGGFIYMDGRHLARDLRGGLVQLTWAQFSVARDWAKAGGSILAVGDIVPLLFAWLSGAPYSFVGTAKSEYYLRDEAGLLPRQSWFEDRLERWSGSIYHPWERWLMSRSRCKAIFPRDRLTTETLAKWVIPAFDLGNPMMDGLDARDQKGKIDPELAIEEAGPSAEATLAIALLPGSRAPEVYQNWQVMIAAIPGIRAIFPTRRLRFLGAIAPTLDYTPFCQSLEHQGWCLSSEVSRQADTTDILYRFAADPQHRAPALILTRAFNDCLHQADFAIAMAGTATEQFVGLGKPAITLPGKGPQFTPAFAEAQTRLLGPSVTLVKRPAQVAKAIQSLLQDPDRLQLIAEIGRRRMGQSGAAQRIADCLMERLS